MKSIVRSLTPPLVWNAASRARKRLIGRPPEKEEASSDLLFDGDEHLFREYAPQARFYGEYGLGQSTLWVAGNTTAQIRGVDTSKDWIDKVAAQIPPDRSIFTWVDVGPLRSWGRPHDHSRRDNYESYAQALWSGPEKPDLVLIDGRFRVTCFLTSLAKADPGTQIIFDDYTNRPRYHLVEEFLKPVKRTERQAFFVVPDEIDRAAALAEARRFAMVIE